jgi:hypothetical protein
MAVMQIASRKHSNGVKPKAQKEEALTKNRNNDDCPFVAEKLRLFGIVVFVKTPL